jgi:hypothetical protein
METQRLWSWAVLSAALVACGGVTDSQETVARAGPATEEAALAAVRGGDVEALRRWSGAVVLPKWVPVEGRSLTEWTIDWWRWISLIPADRNPEFDLGACDVDQPEDVFFLPPYLSASWTRSCTVPFGKPVLVAAQAVVNDYPCPDPSFQPAPGQTLEAFLREGAVGFNDAFPLLSLTVDGRPVRVDRHRDTSPLFEFQADSSLLGRIPDPCLTGTPQPGVSDGWWSFLLLAPGDHTVVSTVTQPGGGDPFIRSYQLHVTHPRHR